MFKDKETNIIFLKLLIPGVLFVSMIFGVMLMNIKVVEKGNKETSECIKLGNRPLDCREAFR